MNFNDPIQLMAIASRLAQTRARRFPPPDEPRPSEARAFGNDARRARSWRRERLNPTVAPIAKRTRAEVIRRARIAKHAGPAWVQVVPRCLLEFTRVDDIRDGVVYIRVSDHGVRHRVDRMLRAGGRTDFLRRMPPGARDVKLVVGFAPEPPAPLRLVATGIEDDE